MEGEFIYTNSLGVKRAGFWKDGTRTHWLEQEHLEKNNNTQPPYDEIILTPRTSSQVLPIDSDDKIEEIIIFLKNDNTPDIENRISLKNSFDFENFVVFKDEKEEIP